MTDNIVESINNFLIEIRYSPNAKILDYRGTWAETLSRHMELNEWQIQENRFDIYDKQNIRRFFVSYRNAGAQIRNCTTRNYFPDQVNKFLRYVFDQKAFGSTLFVERFGVRAWFGTAFNGTYEELIQRYSTKFVTINPEAQRLINGKVVDVGAPIDFSTSIGNIKSTSGPMPKKQLQSVFNNEDKLPDVALFFDFDYWIRPNTNLTDKEILSKTKLFSGEVWDLNEKLSSLILK